jgi:hypothetical protein
MHIVIAAWMFVTFTMALTLSSAGAGIAFFALVGLGPVALLVLLAAKRRRARGAGRSMPEGDMHRGDDGDAKSDQ